MVLIYSHVIELVFLKDTRTRGPSVDRVRDVFVHLILMEILAPGK